jgi:carbon-monoxide dehydrogenase medium subunit/xanthine dehydrogenase FAD-binding subunit
LLALNTQVEIRSKEKTFYVPLEKFILAPYQTILKSDEMVVGFSIPKLSNNTGFAFIKLGRRNAMSIARMNVATIIQIIDEKISDIRIAVGSVMPTAARVKHIEEMLIDQKPSIKIFGQVGREVADEMIRISGRRWSTEYKEPVISVLVKRTLQEALRKNENS